MTKLISVITNMKRWRTYLDLCKPKVVLLMLVTAYVGMALASPGFVPWQPLIFGLIGIGLLASAAAAINHVIDSRVDAKMNRTQHRPIPTGRVTNREALLFAAVIGTVGFLVLLLLVNTITAVLTLLTLVGYAFIYTVYLKRATPQNIVIGGLAGAMPPLLGWTAVTGTMSDAAWLMVMIIFVWTPPHFWALAIYRHEEYKKIEYPMLTTTYGISYTKNSIIVYTLLLVFVTTMPYIIGMSGIVYLVGVSVLNLIFLVYTIILRCSDNIVWGLKTFRYSILYLLLLFIFIMVDHYI